MRNTVFTLAFAASFAAVAPAHAQLAATTQSIQNSTSASTMINGSATIDATTNVLLAIANDHSYAAADQCSIKQGTFINGNVNMKCKSNVQLAIANNNSYASASQGVIGGK